MTAPTLTSVEQDLVALLGLVDVSRARSLAAEGRYRADIAALYAERAADPDESSPLVSAALLAAVVVVIRRALAAGVDEGARFAQAQFEAIGIPSPLLDQIEFASDPFGDQLVADFLAGQVEVARDPSRDRAVSLRELQRRAELAVVSAFQTGRGFATEEVFKAAAAVVGADLHKLWVARFDLATKPCAACVRLHGQHVPLGAEFPVPDTEAAPYRSPFTGPPRHPNCRCSLVLYMPKARAKQDITPLAMQTYASWALSLSDDDRENYIAATIVHVKAYTRIVDGKLQHVSGYYYNIQTGQKVPAGAVGAMQVKEVSAKQAKSMAKVSKQAQVSTPKGGAPDLTWKPGTYKVDNPGDDDTQIIVHQDGSSTAIYKGITEDNDKNTTAQYLAAAKQQGKVQKISDDPDVPDPDGPGPVMEPDAETNKASTLAEGWYVLKSSAYDGLRVDADGNGELYLDNFTKTLPLKPTAINQISNGNLGDFEEVDESDFKSGWQKEYEASKAGGAGSDSNASASEDLDPAEPGDRPVTQPLQNAPDFKSIQDVNIPEEPPLPADIKYMAAGVAVVEEDGSVWIYEPKGKYAGYEHTWPKGSVEKGFSLQQTAHKELFEETGLEAEITGYLGDYKRSGQAGKFGGKVRIYVARRTGGTPLPDDPTPYEEGGSETASVKNVSFEEAKNLLNINRDKRVLKDVVEFGLAGRAPAVSGPTPSGASTDAPETSANAPETSANAPEASPDIPEAPEGGPGPVVKGGPSLFSVGQHSVQIEEGSQVYKSGKSKDTLYVLQPDGDLIKYNPQGAGVQATKVGSSENPAARAQLLAGLNNATDLGVSIKNSMPQPGTGKALVGGFEMTSAQLGDAISALSANPSGNVAADLKKIGSPLAAGKFHEVAAPFKAYYNNKTKPALIAALKKAQAQTGFTPLSEAPAVAHMERDHGLDTSAVQLGLSDHEAIHQAMHAVDPRGAGHTHQPASSGFISFSGVPVSPQAVAEGLEALKKAPKNETGIKKPLKSIGSPLSGVNLQELANTSSVTAQFKGGNGKVHYGKLKPAVIVLLQDALDKHQTDNPPTAPPTAQIPDPVKSVAGVPATQAQLLEMQAFWGSVDLDENFDDADLDTVAHNPLAYGVDWGALAEAKYGGIVPDSELNAVLHSVVNDYLDKKTPFSQKPSLSPPPEDTSPEISVGQYSGTVDQLKQYKAALDASFSNVISSSLPKDNAFKNVGIVTMSGQLGISTDVPISGLKAAVSDAIQKKIDQAVLETNLPPLNVTGPSGASETLSIGGVSVTKQDLLDAVAAVKASPATGVKGPLKEINSPLSKVDIKAYVEADPLSDPFKGSNGKVHYGKLKAAVAAVLQAKADGLGAAAPPPPADVPDITPAGELDVPSVPEGDAGAFFDEGPAITEVSGTPQAQLQKLMENAKTALPVFGDVFAEAFQKSVKGNKEFFAFDDPAEGFVTPNYEEVAGDYYYSFTPDGDVFFVDEDGNLKKLSDEAVVSKLGAAFETDGGLDDDLAELSVADAGFYTSSSGMSLKVFPDGSGQVVNNSSGEKTSLSDPASVKSMLDLGSWDKLSDTPSDPNKLTVNGVEVGTYTSGFGLPSYDVYPDGTVVLTPPAGPPVLMNLSVAKPYIVSDGITPSSLHMDKPDWVEDAVLDPNGFLVGSYNLENGETFYVTPEGPQALSPQVVSQYLINGEATFGSEFAKPPKLDPPTPEFESLSSDASVPDPLPELPDSATELYPNGTWEGHPVGTWATIDGETLEINEDGPLLSFEDYDDGATPETVLDMIESGDLVWVPTEDSPVPSTPDSAADSDAPVLQPFLPSGYTKLYQVDKLELLDAAKKWAADSGFEDVAAQHLNAATKKEDLVAWLNHWAKGEWDKAYEIESSKVKNHKKKSLHPGSPENPANTGGFKQKKMPPLIPGELPAGTPVPGSWPSGGSYYSWDENQVDAYLLAANMQNPTGLTGYQKKKWAFLHYNGDKLGVDSLSLLGQKNATAGKINSSPLLPPVQKYAPGQAVPLPADFPDIDYAKSAVKDWTTSQLDQYLNHVGPTKAVTDKLLAQSPETKAQVVSLHAAAAAPSGQSVFKDPALAKQQMQGLLDKLQQNSYMSNADAGAAMSEFLKVEGKTFTLNSEQPPLGGGSSSEIFQLSDENGNQFLFKVAPEKFRAEVEHAGHRLAELSGIRVADSQLGTFNGKFGQFQAKVPSKGTLQGVPVADLPLSALKDLMAAHVQDWATANDDAHGNNFLLMPDGKRVMPIDIARSFVRFGKPGSMQLKVGSLSDWTTPYYDGVYKSALSGKLSDSDVDELYRASIKQARRTAGVSDADWGGVISEGLKNRPNFGWTSAKDLPDLVSQALARKNALPEDFENFWSDIYSQLGREKPPVSTSISKWVHSGFTPEFFEQAEAMGNHGASAFFGGVSLEEGSMLGQVMHKTDGGKEFHVSGQLRESADAKLREWLESNLSEDISGGSSLGSGTKGQFVSDAGADNYASWVLSAAKTVSHHHKQGDKNYNSMHIANYEAMKADVAKKLADAAAGNFPSKFKDWPEAQQEYKNLLEYYDGKLRAVQQLMDFNGQSKIGDFDPYVVNVPSPKSVESPINLGSGLKVTKINSYYDMATLGDDGRLTLTGKDPDSPWSGWDDSHPRRGQTGKTYQVTLSDGTQIEYKSWKSSDNVARAQQGQLKIKVRNYDGTSSGVDAARSALSDMGLDLQDATEEDLELMYYRHLYGVATDRMDQDQGKVKEVIDDVKANLPGGAEGTPALDAAEELKRWRAAWSRLDPAKFNTFLANKGWMPKFMRVSPSAPDQRGGQAYWERFDLDEDWLLEQQFAGHSLGNPSIALNVVKSGGLFSTEDRVKLLGQWIGGMSSDEDQVKGSANFVYSRQNQESYGTHQIYFSPNVLKRTTNYTFNNDFYGEMDYKKTHSQFDLKEATKNTGGKNELMVKRMVSLLDDIELIVFPNSNLLQEAIQYLKSKGVTKIRGLPIEDRLVLSGDRSAAMQKIKEHNKTWKEENEDFTGLAAVA